MYVVVFNLEFNDNQPDTKYKELSKRLNQIVVYQPGFIKVNDFSNGNSAVSISYWDSKEDIISWSKNKHHIEAKEYGKNKSYKSYSIEICELIRKY